MNTSFTLLTKDQVYGENRLEIFKKCSPKAKPTDYAILLGSSYSIWGTQSWMEHHIIDEHEAIFSIDCHGQPISEPTCLESIGVRPAVRYSDIAYMRSNERINEFGIKEVEYGEYLKTAVDSELFKELWSAKDSLEAAGKSFTAPDMNIDDVDNYASDKLIVYMYKGEKYVLCKASSSVYKYHLSNNTVYGDEYCFIKVEPIVWLVDEKNNIAVSKDILFSGIQYYIGKGIKYKFETSNIKRFLDVYFANEIMTPEMLKVDPRREEEIKSKIALLNSEKEKLEKRYRPVRRYRELLVDLITLTTELKSLYSNEDETSKIKKKINMDALMSDVFEQD